MTRVREMLERSRKSLLDGTARQRLEGSTRQILQRSRDTVAQIVGPQARESDSQEVLAGICSSVALRDLNLVDSLLEQLEKMEANEDDPEALAKLYKLDHLATRLRRNGENLRVLAGRDAGRGTDETASLVDVIRAGMSSIEHYTRVELGKVASLGVVGLAADDVSRLLAELLDNATTHSPPTSSVTVSAHLTEQGSVMIRVEDSGIGLPAARLSALNERLATAPVLDRNSVQHMGLAVVRRLSTRHGIRVWLARRAPHGTIASVLLPVALVHDGPVASSRADSGVQEAPAVPTPPRPLPKRQEQVEPPASANHGFTISGGLHPQGTVFTEPESSSGSESRSATTPNGLPRRVPQSLKESAVSLPGSPEPESAPESKREGHEQLLADLGAFAEGEEAAHQERETAHGDAAPGPHDETDIQHLPEGHEK
ncbi:ATP-binding protein [Parasphingorhabdus pacifica]